MRVLVLGAGYAGLVAARTLERRLPEHAELVVVDETGEHLVQHELHRVVRRPEMAERLSVPLDAVLDRAEVRTARVAELDAPERQATLADGTTLEYDGAAVCLGARTADYGLPGVAEHGLPLKRLAHARAVRERFDEVAATGGGRLVVGGAGLSGVQVAGELAALAEEEEVADTVSVTIVEMADTVAPGFPDRFQTAVREALEDLGVRVRTGTTIERATGTAVHTEGGETITAAGLVWAGGIRGSDVLAGGRPEVRADLRLEGPTFAAGDAVRAVDGDGEPVPATAQAATAAGEVCAANVLAAVGLDGRRPRRFTFDSLGWLVSVGDDAVAQVGPSVFTGAPARALKATAGLRYLARAGAVSETLEIVQAELYG